MDDSNKRVIKVNPDLFKIPDNTRKKAPKAPKNKEIKVKSSHEKNKSIKKKLLNFIRTKQQNLLKERAKPELYESATSQKFHDEFQESLDYLSQLVEDDEKKPISHTATSHTVASHTSVPHTSVPHTSVPHTSVPHTAVPHTAVPHTAASHTSVPHNSTIKNYHSYEDVNIDFPENIQPMNMSSLKPNIMAPPIQISQPPKYGCLKNGSLPTYRNWRNQTQKNYAPIAPTVGGGVMTQTAISPTQLSTFKQTQNLIESIENEKAFKKKPKFLKKIKRRRFTIGRSKTHPKVGVLVSNKTMRKQVDTKKVMLQQTPIQDVKKFLIKNGFIKVGSVAPNSMLRKMYETVSMICGNVTNHNSRNLLYNYFHYNE